MTTTSNGYVVASSEGPVWDMVPGATPSDQRRSDPHPQRRVHRAFRRTFAACRGRGLDIHPTRFGTRLTE
jgi:hypothetical protein